jgi:hypothetical protein
MTTPSETQSRLRLGEADARSRKPTEGGPVVTDASTTPTLRPHDRQNLSSGEVGAPQLLQYEDA